MILNERETRHNHLIDVARQIMTAARTAPKGKGMDIIEIIVAEGDDLKVLSDKIYALGEETGLK
ncbi:MAG: ferredoxin, partial [Dysgonamonadaceae bacterium]|nr:ferredoxin [Dysgonamonadaceae bacterium]